MRYSLHTVGIQQHAFRCLKELLCRTVGIQRICFFFLQRIMVKRCSFQVCTVKLPLAAHLLSLHKDMKKGGKQLI